MDVLSKDMNTELLQTFPLYHYTAKPATLMIQCDK